MKTFKILAIITLTMVFDQIAAQTVFEHYNNRNYKELIKYADKTDDLNKEELYCVGYAFFQLENDKKAIEMYDKAIAKGLDDDHIYLYKGLALRFDKQYDKAKENFRTAIDRNPQGQKNFTELANTFYFLEEFDSALVYFYEARKLKFELGDPYIKIPNIYHLLEDFTKALEEYKISAELINRQDPMYLEILKSIGLLEYTDTKNYENAIKAYAEMISLSPENYDLYPKLIKAYYANENFHEGDSLIAIMKTEYENNRLSTEYQKYGSVSIDEFEWKGQKLVVYKYFDEPKETLDLMYKIYLLSKDGKSIERRLMTEKTIQLGENGAKHLLCEKENNGTHYTYPYGWSTDDIDYKSLKKAVIAVLNDELKPTASSNFSKVSTKESPKKKKKKRKKKKKKN